ncbi:unnamed protein product [Vitrella brassicaformis CCMP3155]|uniref:RRM domain-containing protein n=1 Tax=Vitrella brassicaformis (strain CCMP3155) TaxID=1169540 RepID=A0A0G4FA59_VITBC|nr:unnamed protein product [Vitrella brassicaformis CCMP3155]|eukprot:CEM09181.1 unnamed protein product [Vitrella brassicaformis CCMP3155]
MTQNTTRVSRPSPPADPSKAVVVSVEPRDVCTVSESDIHTIFGRFGTVEGVVADRGFAIVVFDSPQTAQQAQRQLHGQKLLADGHLRVVPLRDIAQVLSPPMEPTHTTSSATPAPHAAPLPLPAPDRDAHSHAHTRDGSPTHSSASHDSATRDDHHTVASDALDLPWMCLQQMQQQWRQPDDRNVTMSTTMSMADEGCLAEWGASASGQLHGHGGGNPLLTAVAAQLGLNHPSTLVGTGLLANMNTATYNTLMQQVTRGKLTKAAADRLEYAWAAASILKPPFGGGAGVNTESFPDTLCPSFRKYTCKFPIGIPQDTQFDVSSRIIGHKGGNMKRVIENSHYMTKLRLRGRGSDDTDDLFNTGEPVEPLHLCVSCPNYQGYRKACDLVAELVNAAHEQYLLWCHERSMPLPPTRLQVVCWEQRGLTQKLRKFFFWPSKLIASTTGTADTTAPGTLADDQRQLQQHPLPTTTTTPAAAAAAAASAAGLEAPPGRPSPSVVRQSSPHTSPLFGLPPILHLVSEGQKTTTDGQTQQLDVVVPDWPTDGPDGGETADTEASALPVKKVCAPPPVHKSGARSSSERVWSCSASTHSSHGSGNSPTNRTAPPGFSTTSDRSTSSSPSFSTLHEPPHPPQPMDLTAPRASSFKDDDKQVGAGENSSSGASGAGAPGGGWASKPFFAKEIQDDLDFFAKLHVLSQQGASRHSHSKVIKPPSTTAAAAATHTAPPTRTDTPDVPVPHPPPKVTSTKAVPPLMARSNTGISEASSTTGPPRPNSAASTPGVGPLAQPASRPFVLSELLGEGGVSTRASTRPPSPPQHPVAPLAPAVPVPPRRKDKAALKKQQQASALYLMQHLPAPRQPQPHHPYLHDTIDPSAAMTFTPQQQQHHHHHHQQGFDTPSYHHMAMAMGDQYMSGSSMAGDAEAWPEWAGGYGGGGPYGASHASYTHPWSMQ